MSRVSPAPAAVTGGAETAAAPVSSPVDEAPAAEELMDDIVALPGELHRTEDAKDELPEPPEERKRPLAFRMTASHVFSVPKHVSSKLTAAVADVFNSRKDVTTLFSWTSAWRAILLIVWTVVLLLFWDAMERASEVNFELKDVMDLEIDASYSNIVIGSRPANRDGISISVGISWYWATLAGAQPCEVQLDGSRLTATSSPSSFPCDIHVQLPWDRHDHYGYLSSLRVNCRAGSCSLRTAGRFEVEGHPVVIGDLSYVVAADATGVVTANSLTVDHLDIDIAGEGAVSITETFITEDSRVHVADGSLTLSIDNDFRANASSATDRYCFTGAYVAAVEDGDDYHVYDFRLEAPPPGGEDADLLPLLDLHSGIGVLAVHHSQPGEEIEESELEEDDNPRLLELLRGPAVQSVQLPADSGSQLRIREKDINLLHCMIDTPANCSRPLPTGASAYDLIHITLYGNGMELHWRWASRRAYLLIDPPFLSLISMSLLRPVEAEVTLQAELSFCPADHGGKPIANVLPVDNDVLRRRFDELLLRAADGGFLNSIARTSSLVRSTYAPEPEFSALGYFPLRTCGHGYVWTTCKASNSSQLEGCRPTPLQWLEDGNLRLAILLSTVSSCAFSFIVIAIIIRRMRFSLEHQRQRLLEHLRRVQATGTYALGNGTYLIYAPRLLDIWVNERHTIAAADYDVAAASINATQLASDSLRAAESGGGDMHASDALCVPEHRRYLMVDVFGNVHELPSLRSHLLSDVFRLLLGHRVSARRIQVRGSDRGEPVLLGTLLAATAATSRDRLQSSMALRPSQRHAKWRRAIQSAGWVIRASVAAAAAAAAKAAAPGAAPMSGPPSERAEAHPLQPLLSALENVCADLSAPTGQRALERLELPLEAYRRTWAKAHLRRLLCCSERRDGMEHRFMSDMLMTSEDCLIHQLRALTTGESAGTCQRAWTTLLKAPETADEATRLLAFVDRTNIYENTSKELLQRLLRVLTAIDEALDFFTAHCTPTSRHRTELVQSCTELDEKVEELMINVEHIVDGRDAGAVAHFLSPLFLMEAFARSFWPTIARMLGIALFFRRNEEEDVEIAKTIAEELAQSNGRKLAASASLLSSLRRARKMADGIRDPLLRSNAYLFIKHKCLSAQLPENDVLADVDDDDGDAEGDSMLGGMAAIEDSDSDASDDELDGEEAERQQQATGRLRLRRIFGEGFFTKTGQDRVEKKGVPRWQQRLTAFQELFLWWLQQIVLTWLQSALSYWPSTLLYALATYLDSEFDTCNTPIRDGIWLLRAGALGYLALGCLALWVYYLEPRGTWRFTHCCGKPMRSFLPVRSVQLPVYRLLRLVHRIFYFVATSAILMSVAALITMFFWMVLGVVLKPEAIVPLGVAFGTIISHSKSMWNRLLDLRNGIKQKLDALLLQLRGGQEAARDIRNTVQQLEKLGMKDLRDGWQRLEASLSDMQHRLRSTREQLAAGTAAAGALRAKLSKARREHKKKRTARRRRRRLRGTARSPRAKDGEDARHKLSEELRELQGKMKALRDTRDELMTHLRASSSQAELLQLLIQELGINNLQNLLDLGKSQLEEVKTLVLQRLGLSVRDIVAIIMATLFILCALLLFVFVGVAAFEAEAGLTAAVTSSLAAVSGLAVNKFGVTSEWMSARLNRRLQGVFDSVMENFTEVEEVMIKVRRLGQQLSNSDARELKMLLLQAVHERGEEEMKAAADAL